MSENFLRKKRLVMVYLVHYYFIQKLELFYLIEKSYIFHWFIQIHQFKRKLKVMNKFSHVLLYSFHFL